MTNVLSRAICRGFTTIAVLCSVGGCTSTNEFVTADYVVGTTPDFPPVNIYYQRPDGDFRDQCREFDSQGMLYHCSLNEFDLTEIQSALKASGTFEDVLLGGDATGYQLTIATATYNQETGKELGGAALAGATLLLLPMGVESEIKVQAELGWRGNLLTRYEYTLPFTAKASLFSDLSSIERDRASTIASHIIKDLQTDESFSTAFLHNVLHSSDYAETFPEAVQDGFERVDVEISRDPLEGAVAMYSHESLEDPIVVALRPVRSWHWENSTEVIQQEALGVRKDIELKYRGAGGEIPPVSEVESLVELENSASLRGIVVGEYGERYTLNVILHLLQDKVVEIVFREYDGGRPVVDLVQSFVPALVPVLNVPQESFYMAAVRKYWRDNVIQN